MPQNLLFLADVSNPEFASEYESADFFAAAARSALAKGTSRLGRTGKLLNTPVGSLGRSTPRISVKPKRYAVGVGKKPNQSALAKYAGRGSRASNTYQQNSVTKMRQLRASRSSGTITGVTGGKVYLRQKT